MDKIEEKIWVKMSAYNEIFYETKLEKRLGEVQPQSQKRKKIELLVICEENLLEAWSSGEMRWNVDLGSGLGPVPS